jgi:hypothetical protein
MVTPKGSISIGRESLKVFYVRGAVAYLQISPLGGSRDETWRGQRIRNVQCLGICQNWVKCDGATEVSDHVAHRNTLRQNNSWVVHEITAQWLPVRCETNRPAAAGLFVSHISRDMRRIFKYVISSRAENIAWILRLLIFFKCRWFCVVCGPKPPLRRHNWLSFDIFQDIERFLIPCQRHVLSRLPPSGETCKYATAPRTQKTFERFSTYWYAPLRRDHPGYCTAEFGNPAGTYELLCIRALLFRLW